MKIFREMFIANLKELLRDKTAIFWFLAFPLIFIFIFGMVFTNDTGEMSFNVGIVVEENSQFTEQMISGFKQVPNFNIYEGNKESEMNELKSGNRSLVLILPGMNMYDMMSDKAFDISVYYDATKQQTNQVLISAIKQIFNEIEREIAGNPRLFNIQEEAVQAEKLSDFDYILPGILSMAIMQLGLFGAFTFLDLREKKIIRGLGVTPLPKSILLGSEILVRLIMGFIQSFLILFVGITVFNVHMMGNYIVLMGLILLGALTFISLGYMLISFVNTMEAGNGLVQVIQFPMMFLSGVFFPIEIMPDYIQPVVKLIPLTYFGDALRQVMVGYGYYSLSKDILILSGWLLVTIVIAIRFWRWD